jgi:hypothetical protein
MSPPAYVKPIELSLKGHAEFTEKWVQQRIADDPAILGLGDLILKDAERRQPSAGRLDLLLQDAESSRRYEVEVQLGKTDESHIIRTIEYWDIEKKRYPQYDHCAVLVAEDITSRFLNVASLFNGAIPLIAIQMRAIQVGESVSLLFTKVLDERPVGLEEDEGDDAKAATDRTYWETIRGTKETVGIADKFLQDIRSFAPGIELKFNKFYIGLAKGDVPDNFVIFRAKREFITVECRIDRNEDLDKEIAASGVDAMPYDARWGRYRVRVTSKDLPRHREFLVNLIKRAWSDGQE